MLFVSLAGENGGDKGSRTVVGFFVAREFSMASSTALVEDCETKIQMVHTQLEGKLDMVDYWGVLHFMFANEVLAGSLCEWNCVFRASCIYDGGNSSGYPWLDVGCVVCKVRQFDGDDFDPCNVELESFLRKLARSLII